MSHNNPDVVEAQPEALSVGRLYMQLAGSRAATIESFLWQTADAPEPLAETLTLAAAGLAHVSGAPGESIVETARAATISRCLIAEAHRHDVRAGALAERELAELKTAPLDHAELIGETAESLIWAAAALAASAHVLRPPRRATPTSSSWRGCACSRPQSCSWPPTAPRSRCAAPRARPGGRRPLRGGRRPSSGGRTGGRRRRGTRMASATPSTI